MPDSPTETDKSRFDYAWKWFSFHAEQRTKVFNFMVLVAGVLATAVAAAYDKSHPDIAFILALVGAVAMAIFVILDARNRDLLWLGEEILIHLERTKIFGESQFILDRKNTQMPFGILWRQQRQQPPQPQQDEIVEPSGFWSWLLPLSWQDALRGKHRFWNPMFGIAFCALFSILALWILATWIIGHSAFPPQPPTRTDSPVILFQMPERTVPPAAAALGHLWPLFTVAGLALIAGAALLLLGRGWLSRLIGIGTLAIGLATNYHVIDKLEIHDLIKFDEVRFLDRLKVEIGQENTSSIREQINSEIQKMKLPGPKFLGRLSGFDPGQSDLANPARKDLEETAQRLASSVCAAWKGHIAKGQEGALLLIGATDRMALRRNARTRYESNFGLARARAEAVKTELVKCGVASNRIIPLVSGPGHTPELSKDEPPDPGDPADRAVDVWAIWSWPDHP